MVCALILEHSAGEPPSWLAGERRNVWDQRIPEDGDTATSLMSQIRSGNTKGDEYMPSVFKEPKLDIDCSLVLAGLLT